MKQAFLVTVVAAALVGCGGGSGATTAPAVEAGRYTLRSVDGASVPASIVSQSSIRITVLSGEFVLSGGQSNGSVVTRLEVTGSSPVTQTTTFVGTYTLNGNALSMRTTSTTNGMSSQATTFDFTFSASGSIVGRFTDGKTYVYQR